MNTQENVRSPISPGQRLRNSATRIPVYITTTSTPNDTLEHVEDPFDDASHHMDHEVERVLREWDTNTQKITHNTFRLRPTVSTSTPNSPFNQRKKQFSNSNSNLSAAGDFMMASTPRKPFDIPEINVSKRQDSKLNASTDSLTEELKSPKYTFTKTGQKLLKMEFDTEGYPPENISVKVSEQKLIIHAQQNEIVQGRTSTTEFCRKIKLPLDINTRMLQCYYNPDSKMLIAEAPVTTPRAHMQSMTSSVNSGMGINFSNISPHVSHHPTPYSGMNGSAIHPGESLPMQSPMLSPNSLMNRSQQQQQLMNVPFTRQEMFGKTMYLNIDVGRVFKADDVTVKVKGQDKLVVTAERTEDNEQSKLSASLCREFNLSDKIIAKTLKAGLSGDGVLKVSALLQDNTSNGLHEQICVEVEENTGNPTDDSTMQDLNFKIQT